MARFFLGLDAGSSVTKAAVFDGAGRQLGSAAHRIALSRPFPGWSEIDPVAAWDAAVAAIRDAVAASGLTGADITAVGLSAAMVGAWLADREGNAVRPGIIWEDSRSQSMLDAWTAADPGFYARVFRSSGSVLQQGCTLPVLAWLKRHEPETLARAAHLFSYKDFLRLRLTGRALADRTESAVAPGSAADRDRSPAMLALFGVEDLASKMPPVADSETVGGFITARAAADTGLVEGTPVAVGAGDVPATVAGAGALQAGMALAVLGTTCMVGVVSDAPVYTPPDVGLLFTLPGTAWYRSMVNVAGTLNLDWAVAALMPEAAGASDLYPVLEAAVSAIPVGSEAVVYLPYLSESGIVAPVVAPDARAGFHGLSPRHGRVHMLRAVYEGVALAFKDLLLTLEGAGDEVLLTGGGARSAMWTQMIADATGKTIAVPAGTEFGARGAALLAATAVGDFRSIREASLVTRAMQRRQAPDPAKAAAWDAAFARYRSYRDRMLGISQEEGPRNGLASTSRLV